MTPYLLTSTGRDSKLDVMSATSTWFGPTSGSVWNVMPAMVSLPQMCTYAASSARPLSQTGVTASCQLMDRVTMSKGQSRVGTSRYSNKKPGSIGSNKAEVCREMHFLCCE